MTANPASRRRAARSATHPALPLRCIVLALAVALLAACNSSESPPGPGGTPLGTPVKLGTATAATENPVVAVDGSGNVIAVWSEDDGTRLNLYAARYTSGAWGSPALLETEDLGDAFNYHIAMNASGEAQVVWIQNLSTSNDLAANRYQPASGWSGAVSIATSIPNNFSTAVGVHSTGKAFVLHGTGPGTPDVWVYPFDPVGGTWGASVPIDNENLGSNPPVAGRVAFLSNGDALAVWQQMDNSWQNAWGNVYTAVGDSWGTAAKLEAVGGAAAAPGLAVGGDDTATAFWQSGVFGSVPGAFANRYSGGAWDAGETTVSGAGSVGYSTSVAADATGNAMAVWLETTTMADVVARRYDKVGAAWDSPTTVASSTSNNMNYVTLACGGNGDMIATWVEMSATNDLWAARYDASAGTWGSPVPLESADGAVRPPAIAADGSGVATVLWRQETADGSGVYQLWALRMQ